uniref:Uncharacterized protein n=1 Tax=Picea glauca TaxID=3330 RepID=A0A117NFV8_PICGL|nr:hypothetical protein ABT39_MTgene2356 [Picea glauca]
MSSRGNVASLLVELVECKILTLHDLIAILGSIEWVIRPKKPPCGIVWFI